MKKHYIKAIIELINTGEDLKTILKNLEAALVRKGHQGLHLAILEGVARELELKGEQDTSVITVADEKDTKHFKSAIAESLKEIGGELESAQVRIDKSLTGGYIASHQGQAIDASYKTKLLKLYRTITA